MTPDKLLYEYAVVRVVPLVEREEFLNVGVIVFCKQTRFIKMKFNLHEAKLFVLFSGADSDQIRENLKAFEKIAEGDPSAGPIALMDAASRFRWLTAVRSSVIQTSRPHPGLSVNPNETINRLFDDLVL
jgi:hypothetical protein